jgi:hypothetical protein
MTIACIWVSYILNVREFHRKAHKPDIYRPEFVQMVCPESDAGVDNEVLLTLLVIFSRLTRLY